MLQQARRIEKAGTSDCSGTARNGIRTVTDANGRGGRDVERPRLGNCVDSRPIT